MIQFARITIPPPREGIDLTTRSAELPIELSPRHLNTRLSGPTPVQRPGLNQLGNSIFKSTARNNEFPISLFGVNRLGIIETFAFTRLQAYRFKALAADADGGDWEHITPKEATDLNYGFTNGSATVTSSGDPTTDTKIAVGKFIKPDSETDRTQWREILSIQGAPTNTLTLVATWQGASTVGNVASSVQKFFTGVDADPWSLAVFNATIYASQGIDGLHKYVGSNEMTAVGGTSVPAKFVLSFNRRLVLGHTFEGGEFKTTRVKWSAVDLPENFSASGSGFEDLSIIADPITALLAGRNVFVVYRERAIQTAALTGVVEAPFAFSHPSVGEGSIGRSAVSVGGLHFFLSEGQVFAFDGLSLLPIGERIKDMLAGLNFSRKPQMFGHYDVNHREYMLFVPTGGDSWPRDVFVYHVPRQRWSHWTVPQTTAATTHISQDSDAWDDGADIAWDDDDAAWDELPATQQPGTAVALQSGTTARFDGAFTSDSGTVIQVSWDTKDFDLSGQDILPDDLKTLARVRVLYEDPGTAVSLRLDVALNSNVTFSYTQSQAVGGSTAGQRRTAFYDCWLTATQFRLRFTKEAGNVDFHIDEVSLEFFPRAPRKHAT